MIQVARSTWRSTWSLSWRQRTRNYAGTTVKATAYLLPFGRGTTRALQLKPLLICYPVNEELRGRYSFFVSSRSPPRPFAFVAVNALDFGLCSATVDRHMPIELVIGLKWAPNASSTVESTAVVGGNASYTVAEGAMSYVLTAIRLWNPVPA